VSVLPMGIYQRLLQYIKPYRVRLIIAILASQGYALFTALVSATLYIIINGLQNKHEVVIHKIDRLEWLLDHDIRFPSSWIPVILVTVFFFRSLFEYISQYQMANVGVRAIRQVRNDLYSHLVNLSHDFYAKGRTGDYISRILNDVGSIQGAITDVISDLVKQPFVIIYNVPMVFFWGGKYAFFALAIFPLVAIPITLLGKNLRRTTKQMQERAADITAFIGETLAGIHVVKAFNREKESVEKFNKINKDVFDFFKKTIRVTLIQRPLIEVMGAGGAALAVWFAIDQLPPDRFGAFVISLFVFYEPLKKLSKVNSTIQQSIAAGTRIFEVIDSQPSIVNRPAAFNFREPIREIHYDKVCFSYEPSKQILNEVSLTVKAGEVIALVGTSGSGKTTLLNMLPRFYDASAGAISINGRDIRDLTLESLRDLIGIVNQETVLFNMTVRENIAYGDPTATLEQVKAAARSAYAEQFIEAMPQGYDTSMGDRGLKLSGGQRQRLSIARALLKNPQVLIFDEATSHLDTESEREVQKALENAMQGRTVFVIAHRLSTVQSANRVLVMQEGRILQQGTSEQLLKEGGAYKRLYDLQFNI